MSRSTSIFGVEAAPAVISLVGVVTAALLFGLYGRFVGLGTWPFGVDEFYLSRSVDHVLASGWPRFPCGGYYTRGLLFQYLIAGLRAQGVAPELAARLLAALSSLLVLPAAYCIAKRIEGPLAGWLTVAILCASVWEIEMARFGRMYAPFQAVFCGYVICYLRYTVDARASAFVWLLALSVLGVLVWEGGSLLGLATLLAVVLHHRHGRLERADWMRIAAGLAVLALLYAATRDLRGPAGTVSEDAPVAAGGAHGFAAWRAAVAAHPGWTLAFAIPAAFSACSLRYVLSYRSRPLAALGLGVALLAALAHAFVAVAGVLALLLLLQLVEWRELRSSSARPFWAALAVPLVFWLSFELATGGSWRVLIDMPDVFERIARPWGRAMPLMMAMLALASAYWFVRWLRAPSGAPPAVRPLLALALTLMLAVAAIPTERIETRYTFFIYPLLIALAVSGLLAAARRGGARTRAATAVGAAAALGCFALGGDLQIRHVAHIDSAAANFRVGLPPGRADHYYPRNDARGVAAWLAAHVRPGDVVLSGIPNLDPYAAFDYFYLDEEDNRFDAYVCADGRTDRWTNHRIIFSPEQLESFVDSGRTVYLTVYRDVETRLGQAALRHGWTVTQVFTAKDGKTGVLRLDAGAAHPRTAR